MKSLLIFLFTFVALFLCAILTGDRVPGAAAILAGVIAASLTAWTVRLYERKFYPLTRERPLHLPQGRAGRQAPEMPRRLAA